MLNTERLCLGCMNDNGGEKVCPICGFDASTPNPDTCLPTKFIINDRYLVGKVLSADGEGITYIGWDNGEDAIVKIKEYFPTGFAHRNPDKTVSIIGGGEYKFNEGLIEFLEINRTLMSSQVSAIVPVINAFEENGTAYSVARAVAAITLEEFLQKNGGILKWEQARALFLPLIDTVNTLNSQRIIHRGISAKTIIVGRDGKLRLSGFSVKSMRVKDSGFKNDLVDGYAAAEQYGFENMVSDERSDVYGLAATIFRVLIGTVPPAASDRINNDVMTIPSHFAEELPRPVLAALANALQVLPQDRTKNIEKFKNELVYGEIQAPPVPRRQKAVVTELEEEPIKAKGGSAKYAIISAVVTVVVFLIIALILVFGVFKDQIFGSGDTSSVSEPEYSAPVVDQIGDVEDNAEVASKLYEVPNLKGKYYSEIVENEAWEMFKFIIIDKEFSDEYPKGTVCSQSVAPGGAGAPRDTEIELVISLGSKEIKMPNIIGMTPDEAKLELLKAGFIYENIDDSGRKYDEDSEPGVIVDQSPKYGEKVSSDIGIKIYLNSYEKDNEDDTSSEN